MTIIAITNNNNDDDDDDDNDNNNSNNNKAEKLNVQTKSIRDGTVIEND